MSGARAVLGDDALMSADGPGDGSFTPSPATPAPAKRRNPWIWICALLAIAAGALLIWALTIRSDLDSTQQDVDELESQVEQNEETGSDVLAGAKALYEDLTQQLGATSEDLATTEDDIDEAEQAAAQAEQQAQEAEQQAAQAASETDKANAESEQAKAEAQAAESEADVVAECANAYVSAFGTLFEGDSLGAQIQVVGEQLKSISADCKAALGGTNE